MVRIWVRKKPPYSWTNISIKSPVLVLVNLCRYITIVKNMTHVYHKWRIPLNPSKNPAIPLHHHTEKNVSQFGIGQNYVETSRDEIHDIPMLYDHEWWESASWKAGLIESTTILGGELPTNRWMVGWVTPLVIEQWDFCGGKQVVHKKNHWGEF